jgi:hypothetical protein
MVCTVHPQCIYLASAGQLGATRAGAARASIVHLLCTASAGQLGAARATQDWKKLRGRAAFQGGSWSHQRRPLRRPLSRASYSHPAPSATQHPAPPSTRRRPPTPSGALCATGRWRRRRRWRGTLTRAASPAAAGASPCPCPLTPSAPFPPPPPLPATHYAAAPSIALPGPGPVTRYPALPLGQVPGHLDPLVSYSASCLSLSSLRPPLALLSAASSLSPVPVPLSRPTPPSPSLSLPTTTEHCPSLPRSVAPPPTPPPPTSLPLLE